MRSIIWLADPLARALREHLQAEILVVSSALEFFNAPRDTGTISFVDKPALESLETSPSGPVVVICDEPLHVAISSLTSYPWVSHVLSAAMLRHPMARDHLRNVITTLMQSRQPRLADWLGDKVTGRRIRLAQASKRTERLERMGEFLTAKGVESRTVDLLRDAAEELLTNAFYDAPVAAGAVDQPLLRTQDVSLPETNACDMVYGCSDDLAIVRVRDPFGSLSRPRLVAALTRCARSHAEIQTQAAQGAGVGLWRIFSVASFVAISVVNNRQTEVLVGVARGNRAGARPYAFHLFFKEHGQPIRRWKLLDTDSNKPGLDHSVTIVHK